MNFIARVFADGSDFIGTDVHRTEGTKAGRSGLGDCICEISNLYQTHDGSNMLVPNVHGAFAALISMLDQPTTHNWIIDHAAFNVYANSKSQQEVEFKSGRKTLICYPEYDDYIKLDKNKFEPTPIPAGEYATIQRRPRNKKSGYTPDDIKTIESKYDLPLVDVGGQEHLGLNKLAYIIDNARFHVGIDSGMSHFALMVKPKRDVHIYVKQDRVSGVAYRWINKGYRVRYV
jgi:hypothetical protein